MKFVLEPRQTRAEENNGELLSLAQVTGNWQLVTESGSSPIASASAITCLQKVPSSSISPTRLLYYHHFTRILARALILHHLSGYKQNTNSTRAQSLTSIHLGAAAAASLRIKVSHKRNSSMEAGRRSWRRRRRKEEYGGGSLGVALFACPTFTHSCLLTRG